MTNLALATVILILLAGCSPGPQLGIPSPVLTPTMMIHQSSMGELESDWGIPAIPEEFRGDWRLQPMTDEPLDSEFGGDYSSPVFRLTESPADCRVLLEEPDGLRRIGTMPYVFLDGEELVAVFTGDFHLTYSLRIRRTTNGEIVGVFEHAGSGVVYFEGDVRLVTAQLWLLPQISSPPLLSDSIYSTIVNDHHNRCPGSNHRGRSALRRLNQVDSAIDMQTLSHCAQQCPKGYPQIALGDFFGRKTS
jgi:hypothetical protein